MACCLTAPSHYLNQCWLIIRGVLWHTSESSFAGIAQGIDSGYEFEKDILKNIFKSPRGQWVKTHHIGSISRQQRVTSMMSVYVLVWASTSHFQSLMSGSIKNNLWEWYGCTVAWKYIELTAIWNNEYHDVEAEALCGNLICVLSCNKQPIMIIASLRPSDAYMRQQIRPSLVQIMACRLVGAKSLSEPTLDYCELEPSEQTSAKFLSIFKHFPSIKCIWKCRLQNRGHFVSAAMCQAIR